MGRYINIDLTGCVEEVLNPSTPARTVYTTNETSITYDGILFGGELWSIPTEGVNPSLIFVDIKPAADGIASYAFQPLTEVSFTVEGVRWLRVVVFRRSGNRLVVSCTFHNKLIVCLGINSLRQLDLAEQTNAKDL